ncbi:MAG: signal peptidase II [Elusimicrobia bacterium]|nr:signal peptidase II [Elusimicrobiota bacterium]
MKPAARAGVMAAIVVADRLAKYWAVHWLMPRSTLRVLPFFRFTYVENTGAAFGIGFSRNGFFIGLSSALLAMLLYLQSAWMRKNFWLQGGLVLVAGGAVGNLYDRVAYGYVVDFLDFRVWPVFNLADSCVTIGACCLAWGMKLEDAKDKQSA